MATSFVDIYDVAISSIDDPTLTRKYRENYILFFQTMYTYLMNAIPRFDNPNSVSLILADRQNPSGETELFVGDGVNDNFVLTTTPLTDSFFDYRVDDISVNATYDIGTNSVTFDDIPPLNSQISVTWYFAGQFNQTLNDDIINILGRLLDVCWAEKEKNFLLDIRRLLNDTDFKLHDAAASTRSKTNWYDEMREEVDKRMNRYGWSLIIRQQGR